MAFQGPVRQPTNRPNGFWWVDIIEKLCSL